MSKNSPTESKKDTKEELDFNLSKEERAKVSAHFNKHIGKRSCHICGNRKWHPLPSVYTASLFDRVKNHHRSDYVMPVVKVACNTCGAITEFSTFDVGIDYLIEDEGVSDE